MKTRKLINVDQWQIESEPGDGTHYSYITGLEVHSTKAVFYFVPSSNHFKYPHTIDLMQAERILSGSCFNNRNFSDEAHELSKTFECNVFTVFECCRTAIEIVNED